MIYVPYISDESGKELKYTIGDATNPQSLDSDIMIIPHVCNNKNRWGAGFVLALSKKWEEPEEAYHKFFRLYSKDRPALGENTLVQVEVNTFVLNMIAQDGTGYAGEPRRPLRYKDLAKCMSKGAQELKRIFSDKKVSFHCPQFGAGLAGGDWNFIETLIKEIWVDSGFDTTVYLFDDGKNKILLPNTFNRCPNCGASDPDISWGGYDYDGTTFCWQNADCQACGCEFEEVYQYSYTEFRPVKTPE